MTTDGHNSWGSLFSHPSHAWKPEWIASFTTESRMEDVLGCMKPLNGNMDPYPLQLLSAKILPKKGWHMIGSLHPVDTIAMGCAFVPMQMAMKALWSYVHDPNATEKEVELYAQTMAALVKLDWLAHGQAASRPHPRACQDASSWIQSSDPRQWMCARALAEEISNGSNATRFCTHDQHQTVQKWFGKWLFQGFLQCTFAHIQAHKEPSVPLMSLAAVLYGWKDPSANVSSFLSDAVLRIFFTLYESVRPLGHGCLVQSSFACLRALVRHAGPHLPSLLANLAGLVSRSPMDPYAATPKAEEAFWLDVLSLSDLIQYFVTLHAEGMLRLLLHHPEQAQTFVQQLATFSIVCFDPPMVVPATVNLLDPTLAMLESWSMLSSYLVQGPEGFKDARRLLQPSTKRIFEAFFQSAMKKADAMDADAEGSEDRDADQDLMDALAQIGRLDMAHALTTVHQSLSQVYTAYQQYHDATPWTALFERLYICIQLATHLITNDPNGETVQVPIACLDAEAAPMTLHMLGLLLDVCGLQYTYGVVQQRDDLVSPLVVSLTLNCAARWLCTFLQGGRGDQLIQGSPAVAAALDRPKTQLDALSSFAMGMVLQVGASEDDICKAGLDVLIVMSQDEDARVACLHNPLVQDVLARLGQPNSLTQRLGGKRKRQLFRALVSLDAVSSVLDPVLQAFTQLSQDPVFADPYKRSSPFVLQSLQYQLDSLRGAAQSSSEPSIVEQVFSMLSQCVPSLLWLITAYEQEAEVLGTVLHLFYDWVSIHVPTYALVQVAHLRFLFQQGCSLCATYVGLGRWSAQAVSQGEKKETARVLYKHVKVLGKILCVFARHMYAQEFFDMTLQMLSTTSVLFHADTLCIPGCAQLFFRLLRSLSDAQYTMPPVADAFLVQGLRYGLTHALGGTCQEDVWHDALRCAESLLVQLNGTRRTALAEALVEPIWILATADHTALMKSVRTAAADALKVIEKASGGDIIGKLELAP